MSLYNDTFRARLNIFKEVSALAKTINTKGGFINGFASVAINSNIAEFVLELLIDIFTEEVRINVNEKSKVNLGSIKKKSNRISGKIDALKSFEFPNRDEVIGLFTSIQKDRDNVFHNLMTAKEKNIDIDVCINRVQENTIKLRVKAVEILEIVWSIQTTK